jgi:hypothetical protein
MATFRRSSWGRFGHLRRAEDWGHRFGAYNQDALEALHGGPIPKADNGDQKIPEEQIPVQPGTDIWNTHLGIDDEFATGGKDGKGIPVDEFTDAERIGYSEFRVAAFRQSS